MALNADKSPAGGFNPLEIHKVDRNEALQRLINDPSQNMGALFFGRLVDADVDSFDPALTQALDMILPPTQMIWGRKGKPRSHRVYMVAEDFKRSPYIRQLETMEKLKIGDVSYSVELRGGDTRNGMYTVLPGSKIDMGPGRNKLKGYDPEGEVIEWADEFDPSISPVVVDVKKLIDRIRMAQAVAILAPYWIEGRRNDMALALAGLLWRIRSLSVSVGELKGDDEPDEGRMIIDMNDAEMILRTICVVSNDDLGDINTRLANLHSTWRKLNEDPSGRITGGGRLAEMMGDAGADIVARLYVLLSDDDKLRELEELCAKFVVWYGEGALVDLDMVRTGHETPFMNRKQATDSMANRKMIVDGKRKNIADVLYNSPLVERVHGMTFEPGEGLLTTRGGSRYVNQWRGFDTAPHPEPVDVAHMDPLLDYLLNVLAAGNQALANWILYWIAHMFQTPAQKSRTALVLLSQRTGTGKTFLGEHIIRALIGSFHSTAVQSIESVTGKYNSLLDNKIFVQANEAINAHKYMSAQVLKSIITDDTMSIEPKFVRRMEKPNHVRLLITSNRLTDAVFIDASPNERRFTVSEVSDCHAGDLNYWETMVAWCRTNRPQIMRFLLDLQFDTRVIQRAYTTPAKALLQGSAAPIELLWIMSRLDEGFIISSDTHRYWFDAYHNEAITNDDRSRNNLVRTRWPNLFHWDVLEEDLQSFARKNNRNYNINKNLVKAMLPPSSAHFVTMVRVQYRTQDETMVQKRVRLYSLPSEGDILCHLRDMYGYDLIESLRTHHETETEMVDMIQGEDNGKF